MLGIIDQPEIKDVPCDHQHLEDFAHDKPGNFRYVPNVGPGPSPPNHLHTSDKLKSGMPWD